MATTTTDSLSELERRAETTRAELAQTVDALHSRVSPGAIKADIKSYVRDNPLQAAAIAVGAAYPVWRLIGAMPAPVLLIGAGLAMARRGTNGARPRYSSSSSTASRGEGMVSTLKDKASGLAAQVSETAHDAVDRVRDMASDTTAEARDRLSDTYQAGREAAADALHRVGDRASEGYATARDTLTDAIDRHPLLVGAAALLAGGILASAVPVSRSENRLMGEAAGDLRRRSQDLAKQGLREAQNVAREVYDTASEEVSAQGLTPDAARRTARAAVESARGAMETTTTGGSRRT